MQALLVALTWLSALGSALVAGIFFAFSAFVMAALSRLPPGQGIAAMQSVNVVVVRSWFMAPFMGTVVTAGLLALAALVSLGEAPAIWRLLGAALYIGGTFLVTIVCNVPLNDALAAVAPDSTDGVRTWTRYLKEWVFWNHVRTAAALAATVCFILALG